MKLFIQLCIVALVLTALGVVTAQDKTFRCPVDVPPGTPILHAAVPGCGGGMAGDGWDGSGQNATTLFWHVSGGTPDFGSDQRAAIIQALQTWANVVQITFVEIPVARQNRSLDFNFFFGDHSASEPQEAGNGNCPFDGAGGTLAHAGFPPGVGSLCGGTLAETFSGNVHFDEAETWERDGTNTVAFSLTLIASHEIGHAIGLTHSSCGADLMRPTFSATDVAAGLSANDLGNIQAGYASGQGAVLTLNDLGVWVDRTFSGTELGTQPQPFNTVGEGVAGVPPNSTGVIVHLQTGSYSERPTILQPMVLKAENGPVTIGQ